MLEFNPKDRTWAEIDLGALAHNYRYAREKTGKPVMCVVKANAYGHGAAACAKFLQEQGADAFAVACLPEAVELRDAGVTRPILILGHTDPAYAELLARYDIMLTVVDEPHALALSEAAQESGVTLGVHIKLDTGMTRMGILAQGKENLPLAAQAAERISRMPGLSIKGMYTHFASADEPNEAEFTRWQMENFNYVLNYLTQKGLRPEVCHASNSAAIMEYPDSTLDMVREGIMLYGLYPDNQPRENGSLKPVMTLKAAVGQVREVPEGATVSYGRTFTCARRTRIAVVSAGYADGYSRRLSGKAYAVIKGRRYPQIGRVCMDVHMLDVTGGDVSCGDEAILWGADGMSVEEAANIIGTVNYELTCLITPRCPRVYVNTENETP